jgi:4-methoxybenzoate monooxygenase (O-demethylating)
LNDLSKGRVAAPGGPFVHNGRPSLDLDPFDLAALLDPIPCDTAIREASPAVWLPRHGIWAMGRHAQVHAAFSDWQSFSSAAGTGLTHTRKETPWRKQSVILEADPPQHSRTRSVLAQVLSPKAIGHLRQDFQAAADVLVDGLVQRRHFDAAADLAAVFPMQVLPDAVGLPQEGREHLLPYANLNFNAMGPKNSLYERAVALAGDAPQWVVRQCKRENLRPNGFGADIFAAYDRGELELEEAELLVRVFLTAALDTTIYGIGLALHAFALHPAQWDLLREDPTRTRAAFDETLRYTAPSPFICRTTTREIEIEAVTGSVMPGATEPVTERGTEPVTERVTIGADEKVMLCVAAANRDPRRWERPNEFDITRRTSGHVAFGTGIHGCVGQVVARMEAEAVLNALRTRVRRIELDGEPVLKPTNWLRGFERLPVRVVPL